MATVFAKRLGYPPIDPAAPVLTNVPPAGMEVMTPEEREESMIRQIISKKERKELQ